LLEINKITGDIIQARGTGLINLGLDPKDDTFSILGDCSVESGSYLFGLQGIVSKGFRLYREEQFRFMVKLKTHKSI